MPWCWSILQHGNEKRPGPLFNRNTHVEPQQLSKRKSFVIAEHEPNELSIRKSKSFAQ